MPHNPLLRPRSPVDVDEGRRRRPDADRGPTPPRPVAAVRPRSSPRRRSAVRAAALLALSLAFLTVNFRRLLPLHRDASGTDPLRPSSASESPPPRNLGRRLEFVHVTKTGGSSIEYAAARAGIAWGACHWKRIRLFGVNCSQPDIGIRWPLYNWTRIPFRIEWGELMGEPWHTPHRFFRRDPYEGARTFVVVRNPYDRILSEYYCRFGGYKGEDKNDVDVMNRFLRRKVQPFKRRRVVYGVHFLPQHLYVYSKDGDRIVDHVLKFENLDAEFPALMRDYGLPVATPGRRNARNATESRLTSADLTEGTIAAINRFYAEDFRRFGYRMVTRGDELRARYEWANWRWVWPFWWGSGRSGPA